MTLQKMAESYAREIMESDFTDPRLREIRQAMVSDFKAGAEAIIEAFKSWCEGPLTAGYEELFLVTYVERFMSEMRTPSKIEPKPAPKRRVLRILHERLKPGTTDIGGKEYAVLALPFQLFPASMAGTEVVITIAKREG